MKKTLLSLFTLLTFGASAQVTTPEVTKTKLSRTGWTIVASSEETAGEGAAPAGRKEALLDNNNNTFWSSAWQATMAPFNHTLDVNLQSAKSIGGIFITNRNHATSALKTFNVYTSIDGNTWVPQITNATAQISSDDQFFDFPAVTTTQYYRIEVLSNWGGINPATAIAETGAFESLTPDLTAYSRTTWTATGSTTQGTGGTGDNGGYVATVDNNASTYWHSQYNPATTLPQWLEFDMQSALLINKISLVNRPSNTNGSFKKFTVSYKLNSGDAWVQLPTSFSAPTTANPAQISIPLGVRITARYIRLDITEVAVGNFAMLAEFRAHLDSTLPVELTSFTAKTNGSTVNLNWTTASEQNASHFNITRSTDGTNFSTIGKLAAAGNSSSAKKYNFTDFTPANGINYYQLQQVDLDGTVAKFDVKQAKVSLTNTELAVVSTTASTVTVTVKGSDAKTGTITITNTLGQKIASQNINLANGASTATINTNNAKGLLIITLNTATQSLSKKIIK